MKALVLTRKNRANQLGCDPATYLDITKDRDWLWTWWKQITALLQASARVFIRAERWWFILIFAINPIGNQLGYVGASPIMVFHGWFHKYGHWTFFMNQVENALDGDGWEPWVWTLVQGSQKNIRTAETNWNCAMWQEWQRQALHAREFQQEKAARIQHFMEKYLLTSQ